MILESLTDRSCEVIRPVIFEPRIDFHGDFNRLVSSKILDRFRIKSLMNQIGNIRISQLMGSHCKVHTTDNLSESMSSVNGITEVVYEKH